MGETHAADWFEIPVNNLERARKFYRSDPGVGMTLVPTTDIGEYRLVGHFEESEGNRVTLHFE